MEKLFDPCVNRTLELIDGQVASVLKAGLGKPKLVLVVGGFGRNAYLYSKIEEYARARGIQTRRPKFPYVLAPIHVKLSYNNNLITWN